MTDIIISIIIVIGIYQLSKLPRKELITDKYNSMVVYEKNTEVLLGYYFYLKSNDSVRYVRVYEYDFYKYQTGDTIKEKMNYENR